MGKKSNKAKERSRGEEVVDVSAECIAFEQGLALEKELKELRHGRDARLEAHVQAKSKETALLIQTLRISHEKVSFLIGKAGAHIELIKQLSHTDVRVFALPPEKEEPAEVCISGTTQKAMAMGVRLCVSAANSGFINLLRDVLPHVNIALIEKRHNVTVKLVEPLNPPSQQVYVIVLPNGLKKDQLPTAQEAGSVWKAASSILKTQREHKKSVKRGSSAAGTTRVSQKGPTKQQPPPSRPHQLGAPLRKDMRDRNKNKERQFEGEEHSIEWRSQAGRKPQAVRQEAMVSYAADKDED